MTGFLAPGADVQLVEMAGGAADTPGVGSHLRPGSVCPIDHGARASLTLAGEPLEDDVTLLILARGTVSRRRSRTSPGTLVGRKQGADQNHLEEADAGLPGCWWGCWGRANSQMELCRWL